MEKPYKIVKLDSPQEIERLDNLLTLLFGNLQEIRHRVSSTTPVASQLKEGEIMFLDDGSGGRQLYAKIKNTLFRLPKISTDGTFAANSDNLLPTEKAIKTYADGLTHFYNRGDPSGWDYSETGSKAVIDTDGSWHELNLSSIVPAGAKAVLMCLYVEDDAVDSFIYFGRLGNSNRINLSRVHTQVANQGITADVIVPCDSDRKIEYYGKNVAFVYIQICVKGWFK